MLDAAMLVLVAVLAQLSAAVAGGELVSGLPLLTYALLCFALLTATAQLLAATDSATTQRLTFVAVPIATAAAGGMLALALMPALGATAALLESARLTVLTAAYLLAGRAAFSWAAATTSPDVVADAIDLGAKRTLDALLATVVLLVVSPILVLVALAIKLEDRGPIFFRCRRVGEGGREIPMLKFRKMALGAAGPPLTGHDDTRFTRVGRFLAASKLDELPQLWDVLCGRMSLVGPRPEDPAFVALHPDGFEEILQTKPGVTGLCQLAFAKEGRILDAVDPVRDYAQRLLPKKIEIDLLYARKRGLLFDLQILAWTVVAVVWRKDVAVHRQTGALTLRRRRQPDLAT